MKPRRILFALIGIALCISVSLAAVTPYGNVSNYTSPEGISITTNVPLSLEDIAYPQELFYFFAVFGFVMIGLGVVFFSDSTSIPSGGIVSCGIIAFGCFLIDALSAPLVASQYVAYQGTSLVSINNYLFSSWVGYAMWGGAIAGFVIFIAGVLSYFGWFSRKGVGSAQQGDYLETDGDAMQEDTYRMSAQKENEKRRRGDKIR